MVGLFLGLIICDAVYSVESILALKPHESYKKWQDQFGEIGGNDWNSCQTIDYISNNIQIIIKNIKKSIEEEKKRDLWAYFPAVIVNGFAQDFAQYIDPFLILHCESNKKLGEINYKLYENVSRLVNFLWNMAMCAHPGSKEDVKYEFLGYLHPGIEPSDSTGLDLTLKKSAQHLEKIALLIDSTIKAVHVNMQNSQSENEFEHYYDDPGIYQTFRDVLFKKNNTNHSSYKDTPNEVSRKKLLRKRLESIGILKRAISVVMEMSNACSAVLQKRDRSDEQEGPEAKSHTNIKRPRII